jgi:hypothetical protein
MVIAYWSALGLACMLLFLLLLRATRLGFRPTLPGIRNCIGDDFPNALVAVFYWADSRKFPPQWCRSNRLSGVVDIIDLSFNPQ